MAQFLYRLDWPLAARGSARMKLNDTVLDRRAIFRDNISGVEDFRNLKEIPNSNNQSPKQVCHFEFWSL